jgi:hypothetical protein
MEALAYAVIGRLLVIVREGDESRPVPCMAPVATAAASRSWQ